MNLISRFLRFLLFSIYQLLVVVMNAIFRFVVLVVLAGIFRFLLLPFIVSVFRFFRDWFFLSLTATVNGPGRFIDRLAGAWTERVIERVEDRNHINEIYQFCRVLVGALIVLGWLVAGLFTYSIVRVVFGFFT